MPLHLTDATRLLTAKFQTGPDRTRPDRTRSDKVRGLCRRSTRTQRLVGPFGSFEFLREHIAQAPAQLLGIIE